MTSINMSHVATLWFLLVSVQLAKFVLGIPTYEGIAFRDSIGDLVPGAGQIQAMGSYSKDNWKPKTLSPTRPRGLPGGLAIYSDAEPSYFFINHKELWQMINQTSVLRVNVLNTTETGPLPLQMVLGNKRGGVDGSWRWRGTMLHFELPSGDSRGAFYSCQNKEGVPGIYMFTTPSQTPDACSLITLHNFSSFILQDRPG